MPIAITLADHFWFALQMFLEKRMRTLSKFRCEKGQKWPSRVPPLLL